MKNYFINFFKFMSHWQSSLLFLLIIFSICLFVLPSMAQAFALVGGPILTTTFCIGPPTGVYITVGPPVGGSFIWLLPGTLLYPFYSVKVGSYVLGLASTGVSPCIIGYTPAGTPIISGYGFGITFMGTSL